jgi:hypothetical protein
MLRAALVLVGVFLTLASSRPIGAQEWPQIFDPLVLHTIHLEIADADWQTIQNDETFDIEVPAMLSLDGEPPILVAIRRKSADALVNAPGYAKVAYRIDINELVSARTGTACAP